jgi:hypothetical protein
MRGAGNGKVLLKELEPYEKNFDSANPNKGPRPDGWLGRARTAGDGLQRV